MNKNEKNNYQKIKLKFNFFKLKIILKKIINNTKFKFKFPSYIFINSNLL